MKITIIGRGNVGGALQRVLSANGHDVEAVGSNGGDAADADAVVLAVPGGAVEDALAGTWAASSPHSRTTSAAS